MLRRVPDAWLLKDRPSMKNGRPACLPRRAPTAPFAREPNPLASPASPMGHRVRSRANPDFRISLLERLGRLGDPKREIYLYRTLPTTFPYFAFQFQPTR